MDAFCHELKRAREARGISLSQISDATMIGIHFLEAIEHGNITILPQTYVRAFIREYAAAIGLNPDDVMLRYDTIRNAQTPAPDLVDLPAATTSEQRPSVPPTALLGRKLLSPRIAMGAMIVVGLSAIIVGVWNMIGKEPAVPVEEIPFQRVVRENEQRVAPPPPNKGTTGPSSVIPAADSLVLRAAATELAWIEVIIDQQQPHDYLFSAGGKGIWKARDRFSLTLGNAGGIEFTLNQKQLGALGKRGSVLRNVELNRQTLIQK